LRPSQRQKFSVRNLLWLPLLLFFISQVKSATNQIESVRLWHSPVKTRVVFDVSADVEYKVFDLQSPNRLVVDIVNGGLKNELPVLESNDHVLRMRAGEPKKNVLRVVFDLKQVLQTKAFVLPPNELYGHRLVLDMVEPGADLNIQPSVSASPRNQDSAAAKQPSRQSPNTGDSPKLAAEPLQNRKLVIAIDAGHGGEDPGALGHRGSQEKKITLSIAKRLKQVIDRDSKMTSFLVRTGDYYIQLHDRRQIARAKDADLFISIHADAFRLRSANGLSVFALSQRGATSAMASAIAAKENASDLIGGVSLANKDEVLAKVLVDLSMTATISDSVNIGGRVLNELSKVGRLHSKRVEQAGFAVLKSPDMPSILVETGFITNPDEEQKLGTRSYQTKIAEAIYSAISKFYEQTPYLNNGSYSSPTLSAKATNSNQTQSSNGSGNRTIKHKVKRGDNLSELAEQYGTSIRAIRRDNNLKRTTLWLGETLTITASKGFSRSTSSAFHTVARGDSLSKISARYNVSISHLKRLNGLKGNTVFLGQKLRLSSDSSTVAKTSKAKVHTVKRGDTLSEIAIKYGSSINAIMRHNKMRSKTVYLGQRLKIPG